MSLGISAGTWLLAGAAVGSAVISSNAAGDAADQAQQATDASIAANATAQDKALAAQKPFLDAGAAGVNRLQELLGLGTNTTAEGFGSLNKPFTPGDLTSDPGYQFQLEQGQNALDRKASAGGGFYSGQGLEGAAAFNQGLAGTTYNDAFNRHQTERSNILNPLQALAGQGQSSANQVGGIQTGGANNLASLLTGNANAQGAAGIAGSNAIVGGINSGLTAWQRAQYLNKLNTPLGNSGSSWGTPGLDSFFGGFGTGGD